MRQESQIPETTKSCSYVFYDANKKKNVKVKKNYNVMAFSSIVTDVVKGLQSQCPRVVFHTVNISRKVRCPGFEASRLKMTGLLLSIKILLLAF